MPAYLEETQEGILLRLNVQPRSGKNQVVGGYADALKIKLTSPPVDGAANKCCCDYLAKLFGVAKSNVVIVSGETSRKKRVLVRGVDLNEATEIIAISEQPGY